MSKKTEVNKLLDSEITSTSMDLWVSPVVPSGKSVKVKKFGASVPLDQSGSGAALQWGSGTDWNTIRVICHETEFELNMEFVGDGTKRFRIVRDNKESTPQKIYAWVEALINDAR